MKARQGITTCMAAVAALVCTPVAASADGGAKSVRDFWTQERIAEAEPVQGFSLPEPSAMFRSLSVEAPAPDGPAVTIAPVDSSAPNTRTDAVTIDNTIQEGIRTHGRAFFKIGQSTFSCSGTVVSSTNESTVWAAAHCLYDQRRKKFVNKFVFIPAYDEGKTPFGVWPAEELSVTRKWKRGGPESTDFGSVLMQTHPAQKSCAGLEGEQRRQCGRKNRAATRIQEAVGARGIAFNRPTQQTWTAYGYPLLPQPRFDGEHLEACTSPLKNVDPNQGSPRPIGIDCDMQGGASGGGWVIQDRFLNGLVAYGYPEREKDTVYSPYFGGEMLTFYYSVEDCPLLGCP
jgi:hypothetical protein